MKPVRILHVLGAMNRGGAETWLLHVLRQVDRERIRMDFLVHTDEPAAYDTELTALGARIQPCPLVRDPLRYRSRFLEVTQRYGPYRALHSHVHHFSGYVLWLGRQAGIPLRISHSHTNTSLLPAALSRKVYLAAMGKLITNNATHLLAASGDAATALFGPRWRQDHRAQVLFCGIDLAPFRRPVDRTDVRSEFGFRPSEPVFGHVGRFDMAKNHRFLVEIAAEIVRREPNARFLFVGDGPLRSEIEIQLRATGIRDRVILTGSRPDVPRLLLGAMDAFLFPSRWEGLSLALVEAQAAGLPAIVSDSMPMEADVVPDLINRQSLRQPAAVWAESALHHRHRSTPGTLDIIEGSPFNVITSAKKLSKLYSGE